MAEPSNLKSEEKRPPPEARAPQWVPYAPPQRGFQAQFRQAVRRYAFPVALLLSLAAVGGVLMLYAPLQSTQERARPAAASAAEAPPATPSTPYAGETAFSVASQPAGAEVVLGTDTLGRTPLEPRATRAGAYVLSVYKEGYTALDSVVFLRSDQPLALHLQLTPAKRGATARAPESMPKEGASGTVEKEEVGGAATASSQSAERSAAAEDSSISAEERKADKARLVEQRRAERYQALRDEGDRLYARRKFEAAIEHYQASLRYRPGDAYATGRIQEIRKRLSVVGW